jgi:hypothetical protein
MAELIWLDYLVRLAVFAAHDAYRIFYGPFASERRKGEKEAY